MLIVIPARLRSGRVPNKPMQRIGDKTVIEHTYTNTILAKCAERVVIAVDDPQVEQHCKSFGAATINTGSVLLNNGTERCAYIADQLGLGNSTAMLNVQGDNYEVNPDAIDELATNLLACHAPTKHNTLFCMHEPLAPGDLIDPAIVKVITNADNYALYFSRLPLKRSFKHCGLYGYYVSFLHYYTSMTARKLERAEALEQMRVLENGGHVYCPQLTTTTTAGASINTMQDLDKARSEYNEQTNQRESIPV